MTDKDIQISETVGGNLGMSSPVTNLIVTFLNYSFLDVW